MLVAAADGVAAGHPDLAVLELVGGGQVDDAGAVFALGDAAPHLVASDPHWVADGQPTFGLQGDEVTAHGELEAVEGGGLGEATGLGHQAPVAPRVAVDVDAGGVGVDVQGERPSALEIG